LSVAEQGWCHHTRAFSHSSSARRSSAAFSQRTPTSPSNCTGARRSGGGAAGLHGNYDMVDHQRRQASAHGVKIESLAAAATARPSSSSGQHPSHLPQASPPFVLWSKLSNGATCGVTTQQLHGTHNNQCPLHRHSEEGRRRGEEGGQGRGQISRTMFYSQRHKVSDICLFIVAHHAAVVGGWVSGEGQTRGQGGKQGGKGANKGARGRGCQSRALKVAAHGVRIMTIHTNASVFASRVRSGLPPHNTRRHRSRPQQRRRIVSRLTRRAQGRGRTRASGC
jgi:hypothetical protein